MRFEARQLAYHAPYHTAIAEELARVKAKHGVAILYDCHSIRSEIAFLFDGVLPMFSIGTNMGKTCVTQIEQTVHAQCLASKTYDTVVNGRFKGGWTTRHHGQPETSVHAIQMEIAQRGYMIEKPPWSYQSNQAKLIRSNLGKILNSLDNLCRSGARPSMTNPRHNLRDIFPPTGTKITAKSWLTEAPMRMLMNNLHPGRRRKPP